MWKPSVKRAYLFDIGEDNYICQFGCTIMTDDPQKMVEHLIESHSRHDLLKWNINHIVLK